MISVTRREALRLLAAQLPFALAACSKPAQQIVPYVLQPEQMVPGTPLRFASVLPLSGQGRGVIVTSMNGRPTKIEGNPQHPASLGSTDIFAEADILTLYDPDRSRAPLAEGQIASWPQIEEALRGELSALHDRQGAGLAIVTARLASPTFERQMQALLARMPQARWFAYDPLDGANDSDDSLLALADVAQADLILSFEADVLGPGPDQIRMARAYADRRVSQSGMPLRLVAFEASPTQTGAKADARHAASPAQILEVLIAFANSLGAGLRDARLPPRLQRAVEDCRGRMAPKRTVLLGGPTLDADANALLQWINEQVDAPQRWVERPRPAGFRKASTLRDLKMALESGAVSWLAALGCNPAYDAPADLDLPRHAATIPLLHAGHYVDETASLARWHVPLAHALESWTDLRAPDGTAAIGQPLIAPLHGARPLHELMAILGGDRETSDYELVRQTWRDVAQGDFELWWTQALTRGTIEASSYPQATRPKRSLPKDLPDPQAPDLSLVLRADPSLHDGAYANNAWLQELPKPLTKQVWGHALQIGPALATRLALSDGDMVEVRLQGGRVQCPILITAGQAEDVACLTLGYGRSKAGAIGNGLGVNAYHLRTVNDGWALAGLQLTKQPGRGEILQAQLTVTDKQLDAESLRKRYPGLGDVAQRQEEPESLYPERPRPAADHAWGMVIDTARCIGCNACMMACQSENNIPVVGPDEIERGRQMHWLRVDLYDRGDADTPAYGFQPVPCMHCEKAPCEPVCPVAASVHDGEGLNVQVYNRCIGTRFCEANCPYKVRRFNFRAYADGQEYANLGDDLYRAQKNPDVTVRTRGVMEKCTYCVQRISAARRASERNDAPLATDQVRTACQSACPTRAITFGDLADEASQVTKLRSDARHYALLEELGTKPRTTYLADLRDFRVNKDGEAGR